MGRFLRYREDSEIRGSVTSQQVKSYSTYLALTRKVSASTQNRACIALLFLCRHVLGVDLKKMACTVRARRSTKLPVVLSVQEVRFLLETVDSEYKLMVELLYESGLRLMELVRLRVKDLDFDAGLVYVREGKGNKDRTMLLLLFRLILTPAICFTEQVNGAVSNREPVFSGYPSPVC